MAAATPKYVARMARLPQVLERLMGHPDGLPLATLAAELDVPAEELREDLMAFYAADVGSEWLMGLTRVEVLEFVGPEGDEVDPNEAEVVRLTDERPVTDLGVEYVDASELALVYTAARGLLDIEPDNAELAGAVAVLTETMGVPMDGSGEEPQPSWNRSLRLLQSAVAERRRVRIEYSRAWAPGVSERVIEPYHLVQTRRGWEVDAGPLDERGGMRTFLLSNIRAAEVRGDTFEPPADLGERLAAQRATAPVEVVLPHSGRWAADMYAETVEVLQADEESVKLRLQLLPPLEQRVGLLLLAAGPDAFVVAPAELANAGAVLAEELLVHHGTGAPASG
ncbi:MAG TPA: WYL domain-containing protein [Nocardioides sp.]|nr:WYL domain-containing protein [Nocardioides sp.]